MDNTTEQNLNPENNTNIIKSQQYNNQLIKRKKKKINEKKYERLIKKERKSDIKKLTLFVILTFIIALIFGVYTYVKPIYKDTSDAMFDALSTMSENTFLRAGNTEIYDTNGILIGQLGNEKYEYIHVSDISPYVTKGYIAREDKNFTMHQGVDFKATIRASLILLKNKGAITQGGSTITQQVIKNNLLTSERTYSRKITEIFLAFSLEKEYNKAQIMEFYCNSNYYGNGCYGIEGASQYYFGCNASQLTLSQAAILVATSNSPNSFNPVVNYDRSMEKKELVLDDMLECGYISQEEHDKAVADKPTIVKKTSNVSNEDYLITYAIHSTALKLMENDGFEFKYTFETSEEYKAYDEKYINTYREYLEKARTSGYKIYTSLDTEIQSMLQKSIDENLTEYKDKDDNGIYKLQSAGVCVDNTTNMVVAVVGGREGLGSYNRGYQAERQSGSIIKPLVDFAPAFNEGYLKPASILIDEEVNINGYKPKNAWSGYVGEIDMRTALLKSYNTIAVQTYEMVGHSTALSYLDKMHISSMTYSDMLAPAISVGGFTNGVTVVDMAKSFNTLANGGKYSNNNCITELMTFNNETVYTSTEETTEVFNNDTAFMITNILEGMFKEEDSSGYQYLNSNQHYAGKTGTTNENKDAWFAGYSTYYSTAIWMGYDIPKEMKNVSGGTYPCEIWTEFMDELHMNRELPTQDFEVPYTIKLENVNGERQDVHYSENVYNSRPDGWDYVSTILDNLKEQRALELQEKELQKKAKLKVEEFENFQITNVEEAMKISQLYTDSYNLANQVNESKTRADLLERIAYKYELLNNDVINQWNDAIDAYNENIQKQKDEENALATQQSIEKAKNSTKSSKIGIVEYYINLLNERTIYTEYIDDLINKAKLSLEDCIDYTEDYTRLNDLLSDAIIRAESLPNQNGEYNESTEENEEEEEEEREEEYNDDIPNSTPDPDETLDITPNSSSSSSTSTNNNSNNYTSQGTFDID